MIIRNIKYNKHKNNNRNNDNNHNGSTVRVQTFANSKFLELIQYEVHRPIYVWTSCGLLVFVVLTLAICIAVIGARADTSVVCMHSLSSWD